MASSATSSVPTHGEDADRQRLNELGYAQELNRGMGWFSNFAVSFTIISILTGGITTYYLAMQAGGPVTATLGWLFVGGMSLLVGMAMAEVCSAYPTAGGLYYWSAKMAKPKSAPVASWFTGWINLIGQVAVTASIDYGLATICVFAYKVEWGDVSTPSKPSAILLTYFVILALHGLLNAFGVQLVALLNDISVWWHLTFTAIVVVALFVAPDKHTSIGDSVTQYNNITGWTGPLAGLWATAVGLMLAQYTITGFDASAHMTEETRDAAVSGPRGIVTSIWVSTLVGFVLMLGLSVAVPFAVGSDDYNALSANGVLAAPHIIIDFVGGGLGKFLLLAIIVAQFFCGMASVTANSRMIYAFSRDGAIPGHQVWHRINPRTRTPTNSIWFAVVGAAILGLPSLYQRAGFSVAFFAIVSVAVVGLYVSYVIPVFLRRVNSDAFVPGPWTLGRWSPLVGWAAVIWVVLILIPLLGPQFWPYVEGDSGTKFEPNLVNWAPIAFVVVLGFAGIYWAVSAKRWFTGPRIQGTPEELARIEADLAGRTL